MIDSCHCEIIRADVTPLSDPDLFEAWMARMPESRKRKVTAMRFAEGQRQRLGVGILLFQALERLGIDGSAVRIAEGEFGQPYLADRPEIRFSLSHAGKWALCALSGAPVGCDAEETAGENRERIADRFFHPEERDALAAEPDPTKRRLLFTRIWTRKESYLKATGKGITLGLETFSALRDGNGIWYGEGYAEENAVFSCCVLSDTRPVFDFQTARLDR